MRFLVPILAQSAVGPTAEDQETKTRVITFFAYGAVVLVLLAWVILIRKQKARRRRIHKHSPHTWQLDTTEDRERRRLRRHERRRRTAHPAPPVNPTLAQTSGLPPRRPDDVLPPGA